MTAAVVGTAMKETQSVLAYMYLLLVSSFSLFLVWLIDIVYTYPAFTE
jgi:hypothetical protein